MTVSILSIGTSMPHWVNEAVKEFSSRLPLPWNIEIIEKPALKRKKSKSIESILSEEGERLWKCRPEPACNIALDRIGKHLNSKDFSHLLQNQLAHGNHINFFVGGPEGLHDNVISRCDQSISLSAMTFPHPLVRVILCEQIYRARSISIGHPYHR